MVFAAAAVDQNTTVIFYGGNSNWFAAYAYWIVKLRGFDAVRLLNGGRKKWELESRELVADVPQYPRTSYQIRARERPELRARRGEVLASAGTRTGLVDVRSPEEYLGEKLAPGHLPGEQAHVPGHIPGAVNVPWARAANDDGTFKPADELIAVYSRLGITCDRPVITYCQTGERSCHTWFALTELLGYPDARHYDGSWTEYGSLAGVPVEIG
jgi:thiosulfate/3-mercaptopyruvate sulfurtransferase